MKYLVVSDNHGDRECLVKLFSHYKGKVDGIFHCGDSELTPDDPIWQGVTVVKGNCDFYSEFPEKVVCQLGKDRILITHGHLYNVKFDLTRLNLLAQQEQADVVLFGHSHELDVVYDQEKLFVNPGSIRLPRGKYPIQTYCIIESTESDYHVQYYTRDNQPVSKLSFTFQRKI